MVDVVCFDGLIGLRKELLAASSGYVEPRASILVQLGRIWLLGSPFLQATETVETDTVETQRVYPKNLLRKYRRVLVRL